MTSPKIDAPEVFLLSTAVTSMFARPHQTRADDLARPTYERQLIPARNHYSNPYIGLWVQGYPQPDAGVLTGMSG
jgi:hypothetical protein